MRRCRAPTAFYEKRFSLETLNPPVPMFGTADFVCLLRDQRKLVVADLKYGKGIAVSVIDNPQLKYYALGVLLAFPNEQIDTIETVIIQPRTPGNPIKRCQYDVIEILSWSVDLIQKANDTLDPEAAFNPGSHCRFCNGDGRCAAQTDKALAIAQIEFDDAVDPHAVIVAPRIEHLTNEQISALLFKADILETFITGLRGAAHKLLEEGQQIPGWKMVPSRPTRRWENPDDVPAALRVKGISEDDLYSKKLVSPAQAEEILTKQLREKGTKAKDAKEQAKSQLSLLIVSKSSGASLAPETDYRAALPSRGSEFDFEGLPDRPALPGRGTDSDFGFENKLPAIVKP